MSAIRGECPVCRRLIMLTMSGEIRKHGHGAYRAPCLGSWQVPKPRSVREAIAANGDDVAPWVADMVALRSALARLLMNSVVDDAECTCEDDDGDGNPDTCPECEAMRALGIGDWPGATKAEKLLGTVKR